MAKEYIETIHEVGLSLHFEEIQDGVQKRHYSRVSVLTFLVCLFVWDPQPHFSYGVNSQGRTYGDHPYHPGHSSPKGLVSLSVPSPPVLLSCILHQVRTLACPPVQYIQPIESLVCPFLVFLSYTYIQHPQKGTPQHTSNPTYKLC